MERTAAWRSRLRNTICTSGRRYGPRGEEATNSRVLRSNFDPAAPAVPLAGRTCDASPVLRAARHHFRLQLSHARRLRWSVSPNDGGGLRESLRSSLPANCFSIRLDCGGLYGHLPGGGFPAGV